MKKRLPFIFLLLPFLATAQLTSDDFDSYTPGSFDEQWDGTEWVGWFGGASGTVISDAQAFSGANSLEISDAGSADDLVALLPVLDAGLYEVSFMQYIPSANGAYFNMQHNYTNSAGDWAAEVYFTTGTLGVGRIITNGENTDFQATYDTWVPIRFEFNFLLDEAFFYYNDQLILEWQLSTNAAGGAGLNQINGINFFAACLDDGNGCSSLAYYDDVNVTEIPLPAYDLIFSTITAPSEYTNVPLPQVQAFNLEAQVLNAGLNEATNVEVTATIFDSGNNEVFSTSLGSVPSLASGGTMTLNNAASSFTPTYNGNYTVEYSITLDEMDEAMMNNSGMYNYVVTDSIYARDDGNYTGSIGNNTSVLLGQLYQIYNEDVITGIYLNYIGGAAGETIQGSILRMENGLPAELIESTDVFTLASAGAPGAGIDVMLSLNSPASLAAGEYAVVIEQQGLTNIGISTTTGIFTPNSTLASVDGGGQWAPLESFGISAAMAIRPIFGDGTNRVSEASYASSMKLSPNLTKGQTQLTLELDAPEDVQIEVHDMNGQRHFVDYQSKLSGLVHYDLDLNHLSGGMYFVTVRSENGIATKKLTITK